MAGARGTPPSQPFLYPSPPLNAFPIDPPVHHRDRLRPPFDRPQRDLALKRRFGDDLDRERALLFERDHLMERDRLSARVAAAAAAPGRMFERDRMLERPILLDRRMEAPAAVLPPPESGNAPSSRLESLIGLDRRPENQVGFLGADRRVENAVDRGLDNPVPLERSLETGADRRMEIALGMDRRVDSSGVDRRLDSASEADEDRNGSRPPLRPSTFERMRPVDRERDEEREKTRDRASKDDKQKERDDSAGAIQELVAQYKTALAELTFNSKPIITNLTIIAGENVHAAKVIASTVCAHILEVPIEQKLPSLYLLDSIVKNIGSSYVKQFAARLPEVFIRAYKQVDPSTYPAMQHLFKTWRGVFPSEPLRAIEAELQFNFTANGTPSSNPVKPDESPPQRAGHSIHVNPKYLEAQRQKLQQSSQANNPPPRIQRDDGISGETNYARKSGTSFTEYEHGSVDSGGEGGVNIGVREKTWDRGWPKEGEDPVRTHDKSTIRYGNRNGFEQQPPSPQPLVDAYGNIRGIRAPRFPPVPAQPVQELDNRNRGLSRNWQNSEEEEYIWGDVSPNLPDITRYSDSLRKDKDDWYSGDADKNSLLGSLGGGKPFGLDQPLSDFSGWRRHGILPSIDRPMTTESRVMREIDARPSLSNLQQDIGPRLLPDPILEGPPLGSTARSMMMHRPMTGRSPHPLPQQLSPPSQSRVRPLHAAVSNRNNPPLGLGLLNQGSQVANVPGPTSSTGLSTITGPAFTTHSSLHPNVDSSLGSGLLNLGSLSPVTPGSSLNFSHRQQPQRPPSPPPLAAPSQRQFPPPPPNPTRQHQPSLLSLQQHVIASNTVQHRSQAPAVQPHSSQQPLALHPFQQPQHVQQRPQQPSLVHQSPQQLRPLQTLLPALSQSTAETGSAQQSSQAVPVLPQLPTQLLHSLQQLQRHLPPLSGALPQASQHLESPFQLQSSLQQSQPTQSGQQLPLQSSLTQTQSQQPPQAPQMASVLNESPSTLVSGSQSHGSTNNLLAAFLQSGLMPPVQASQILSHPQSSSPMMPGGSSESTVSQSSQLQPPLPTGPPRAQYTLSSVTNPLPGQTTSTLTSLSSLPLPTNLLPAHILPRIVQPPLPPGPPPLSSQATSSALPPPFSLGLPPASGNNLTSLLSSLMAQGVIAPPSAPILSQPAGVVSNMLMGSSFTNSSLNLLPAGVLPVPSTNAPFATVVSTTLVTAQRTQESSTATLGPTETGTTADLGLIEFRQEFLRERHDSVLNALYSDFPRQCKTCGLRFKHQEEHSKHMDWHVSRNRRQKSSKKVSRKWFVSVTEWLNGTGAAASEVAPSFFAEEVVVKPEDDEVAVPADENQSACALCGEPFEDFYSDETEEWMYKGAVYMNAPSGGGTESLDSSLLGPIVHAKCRSESAATTAADSTDDAELEEDDEYGLRRKRVRY